MGSDRFTAVDEATVLAMNWQKTPMHLPGGFKEERFRVVFQADAELSHLIFLIKFR